MGYYVDKELYHHGIKGQRWGIRRFQNYDGTRIGKGSEPAASPVAKKGLTDEQKKALKIGAGIVAGCLVAYGGYKLATNPKAKALVTNVLYGNKDKRLADLDKEIANMGPEIVKKASDWGNYDIGGDIKLSSSGSIDLPKEVMDMATGKNPFNRTDNCKEVAHAFCESMYSNDSKVIAGKKPRYEGNLYDYVTGKLGWGDSTVHTFGGSSGDQLRNNAIKKINRNFQDGDYGMIGFNGDPKRIQKLRELGMISEDAKGIDGHCFNWIKQNGEVKFFDCSPNGGPVDATNYFSKADFTKDAELVCYNKSKTAK